MSNTILCVRDGAVATVTINRPERRNAMDRGSWSQLGEIFGELSEDTSLRCIVVTGAGGKAFGSGNDISEFDTLRKDSRKVREYNDITIATIHAIEQCLHPTVARIEGFCLGGGLEIALACDVRVAAPGSTFGLPVKNMGIFLDPALADTLVNAIGRTAALELVLEGRFLNTEEALKRGIITRIAPDGGLDEEVAATVERICVGAPLAHRFNKDAIRKVRIEGDDSEAQYVRAASYGDTEDYRNAWTSFIAKKKARFQGR
ncbi:MAG: Short-chain-enoyl-CoA hydratase [Alphaproteobacteria bacterium MarineAlpha11_Bin1]|nr:MAG: Short-chain-enoyl-CoA hydratase [Alphaproteobacteria bacterium MarineAlpha11_Bin1]|tara:strand:+ start:4658 stop:5437 length:780 start_codon:yes stop_codon:yes gene_type:complete